MAKNCISCGKKISFFSAAPLHLVNVDAVLCADCCGEAKALLKDIKCMVDINKLPEIKENFFQQIELSDYSTQVKQIIKAEFNARAQSYTTTGNKPIISNMFYAGFEESINMIAETGKHVSGGEAVCTPVVVSGSNKCKTFVFEEFFFRTGSYASLTVSLVNNGSISAVTAVSSGGGDGFLNLSWGAETDFVNYFWQTFSKNYPHVQLYAFENDGEDVNLNIESNRIGIFGGTFDPIHLGHKTLAEAALKEGGIDKLIVMPARMQPFKQGKRVTEEHHRLAMARLTFEGNDKVEISDYELKNTTISYTYDTMKYLQGIYPEKKLCFILGTDSFLMLEDWYKGIDLLENFGFIVGDRPGYREEELDAAILRYKQKYGTETIKITADMPDISATEIREALQADESASNLVTEAVERYIKENGLYN
ncbi:MAG: nicotinate (nicotinamide) nucleotide adenylyltransferase [Firmicutes bacterium]|nr:nicotinate (nicotinamide) nucleotide adenylyltransferase [Bacillota bacterium]